MTTHAETQRLAGQAAVQRRELEAAGIRLASHDPHYVAGAHAQARRDGRLRARRTGFDPIDGLLRLDALVAPDGTASATATADETMTVLDETRQRLQQQQVNAWKKPSARFRRDPGADDSRPANKSPGQPSLADASPRPGNAPPTPREVTEHPAPQNMAGRELTDVEGIAGDEATERAQDAMAQRQRDAWKQPRRPR